MTALKERLSPTTLNTVADSFGDPLLYNVAQRRLEEEYDLSYIVVQVHLDTQGPKDLPKTFVLDTCCKVLFRINNSTAAR